jgi:photosystem II stability/assembly factor-like uncharacterized protein
MNKLILLSSLVAASISVQADTNPSFASTLASKSLLTDIVKIDDNTLVAVGDRGHILRSTDTKDWQQAKVPINVLLTDVFFLDEKRGWAVGHDATVLQTTDGALNWSVQHHAPKMDKPLFGIHFKDKDNGIVFGAYGLFMRSKDGGASWQQEFHGELLHADDLEYLNDLKANEPEVYKDETSSILPHFNRLLVDGNNAYLVGEVGLLATSSDYGVHWNKVDAFYNGSFFEIAKVPGQGLFVGGLRGNLFNLADSTLNNWQAITSGASSSINRVLAADNRIVVVGNSGLLFSSNDGGKSFKSFAQSDGKAITGGVFVGGKLVLTSEVGVKVLEAGQY